MLSQYIIRSAQRNVPIPVNKILKIKSGHNGGKKAGTVFGI